VRATFRALVCLVPLLAAAAAAAQSTTGSISGSVHDQSKAVLPGVTVEVRNVETGATRSIVTDVVGRYRALNLAPGRYTITAELSGFTKIAVNDVVVQIGRDVPIDLTLSVAGVAENVTVTGDTALIDLSTAVVGGVVSTKQIAELPLNGRSFMQLATLQPGVTVSRATERDFTGGFGGTQVSIAGARPEQTGYLLEGTNISDISDKAPSSVAGVLLGVDTVQEFSVQTHGYSAEFGRAAGGIISAVTKSGTNQFRGTVFEFLRDSTFDAKGYFDKGDAPPPFTRNQFGGTLGGPIVKNKLFFFGSYEGLRERLGTTRIARVPNADAHRGFLPATGGGLREVGVHPTMKPYLDLLWPMPNGRDFGDGTAELTFAPTEPTDEHFFVGKIDWNLRQKDNVLVRVSSDRSDNQVWANDHPLFTDVTRTDTRYITSQWQRIFTAGVLNEARFAANRTRRELVPTPLVDVPKNLFFVTEPYFGYIEVPGLLNSAGNVDDSADYTQDLYQASDTLTVHAGRHTWKTGFDFQRYHFDGFSNSRLGGAFRFRSLEEMLTLRRSATAQADRYTGNLPGTDTIRSMRQNYVAFFAHDDMRLSDRISVSAGWRYEFVTTPHELDGKVAGLLSLDDLESGPKGITPGRTSSPTRRESRSRPASARRGRRSAAIRRPFAAAPASSTSRSPFPSTVARRSVSIRTSPASTSASLPCSARPSNRCSPAAPARRRSRSDPSSSPTTSISRTTSSGTPIHSTSCAPAWSSRSATWDRAASTCRTTATRTRRRPKRCPTVPSASSRARRCATRAGDAFARDRRALNPSITA
jgi:Carboxypeptidase regulatory-like domain